MREFQQEDRVNTPAGPGRLNAYYNRGPLKGYWQVDMTPLSRTMRDFDPDLLTHETFGQFITRRSGFGEMPWAAFGIRMLACAVLVAIAAFGLPDGTGYKSICYIGAGVVALYTIAGTYFNFKQWMR